MEHWKFLLPWYALLFPVSQLTLWCYLMRTILSDEVASAAWIATGVLLLVLCAVADLLLFKALRQSTQLHMTVQRRQLMESSVETQRKRGEALERETAEAVHVRQEISARLLEAAELLQNRRMEAARSCMDSIPAICPPPKRYCAHPVADAILSEKLALCRGESITAVADPRRGIVCGAGQSDGQRHRSLPPSAGGDVPPDHGAWACERRLSGAAGPESGIRRGKQHPGGRCAAGSPRLGTFHRPADRGAPRRTADHGALGRTVYLHGVAWRGGVSKHADKKAFSLRFGRMLFSFTAGWPDNPYMPPAFFCGMPG